MQLKFNSQLNNLDDDDVLSFRNFYLKTQELRYALDIALLGKLSDVLVELLKLYDIHIDLSNHAGAEEGRSRGNSTWFHSGVECNVLNSETNQWHKGKVKLKIALKFCPHASEHPEAALVFSEREAVKRAVMKKYFYAATLSQGVLSEINIPKFNATSSEAVQAREKPVVLAEV